MIMLESSITIKCHKMVMRCYAIIHCFDNNRISWHNDQYQGDLHYYKLGSGWLWSMTGSNMAHSIINDTITVSSFIMNSWHHLHMQCLKGSNPVLKLWNISLQPQFKYFASDASCPWPNWLKGLISGYLVRLAQLMEQIIPNLPLMDFHPLMENLHHWFT